MILNPCERVSRGLVTKIIQDWLLTDGNLTFQWSANEQKEDQESQ